MLPQHALILAYMKTLRLWWCQAEEGKGKGKAREICVAPASTTLYCQHGAMNWLLRKCSNHMRLGT